MYQNPYYQWCTLSEIRNDFFSNQASDLTLNGMWLQQGGATCQTTRVTLTLLQTKFPGRIIFQKGDLDGIFFYGAIRRNQLRLQKSKKTSDMQLLN